MQKDSPAKWAFLAPVFAWLGGGAAAAGSATAAVAAGKVVATKAVTSAAASTAAYKLASGGNKKTVKPIVEGKQPKIIQDNEEKSV